MKQGLIYRWETIDKLLDAGMEGLIRLHYEEVALDRDIIPLEVDWARYRAMERGGQFRAMGCWLNHKLIGYNAFFVFGPYHYKKTPHAFNDIIYIDPAERGEAGIRLILRAEQDLFRSGVVKINYHTKKELLLAVGDRGGSVSDSLDDIELLMDLAAEFNIEMPDDTLDTSQTMGGLLGKLGYRLDEECWTKIQRR